MSELDAEALTIAGEIEREFLRYEQLGIDLERKISDNLSRFGLNPGLENRIRRRMSAATEGNASLHELLERVAKNLGIPIITPATTSATRSADGPVLATDKD